MQLTSLLALSTQHGIPPFLVWLQVTRVQQRRQLFRPTLDHCRLPTYVQWPSYPTHALHGDNGLVGPRPNSRTRLSRNNSTTPRPRIAKTNGLS